MAHLLMYLMAENNAKNLDKKHHRLAMPTAGAAQA